MQDGSIMFIVCISSVSAMDKPFDTDKMAREFCMQFGNQAMQPGQTVFFKFNESKLMLTVAELHG